MRPAFSSTRSAAAFALLLLVLLALPAVLGKSWLPPREQGYASQGWGTGPYPWIQNQIFKETNAIDIAIMGSSRIFNAINTPYVQSELTRALGRPAVVRTLAWGGGGYDALFFIARDLVAHRPVKLIVFYDENPTSKNRNARATFLFRWGEDADLLSGLMISDQALYYDASIIGMPRSLLNLVRPNLEAPLVADRPNYWEEVVLGGNPATQLGCLSVRRGYTPNQMAIAAPFVPFAPVTSASPADALVYSPATQTNFVFKQVPIPDWHASFAQKFAALMHEHDVKMVMLYLPLPAEVRFPAIPERTFAPDIFGDMTRLGIPPAKMFGSLSDAEALKLFADPAHLNQNGQIYFTRLITPALIKLYEDQPKH